MLVIHVVPGDNDTDYSWSSDDEDDQHVTAKPDPADQCTADYDDDFERLSVSSVDSLCDDDEGKLQTSMSSQEHCRLLLNKK